VSSVRDDPDALVIQRLTPGDVHAYRALRLLALADSSAAFGSSVEEEAALELTVLAARLDDASDLQVFGASLHGDLVGMIAVGREQARKERHRAFIKSMFVRPEARRLGIARHLVAHALRVAEGMPGVRQVTLTVTSRNTGARHLYEAHGFTAYGVAPEALFVDGVYHDDVLMVRHFTSR
jgi:ribosomal protein S18 acetylase RimI-like enzyme